MRKICRLFILVVFISPSITALGQTSLLTENKKISDSTSKALNKLKLLIQTLPQSADKAKLLNSSENLSDYLKTYQEQFQYAVGTNSDYKEAKSTFEQVNAESKAAFITLNKSINTKDVTAIDTTLSQLAIDFMMKTQKSFGSGWNTPYKPRPIAKVMVTVRVLSSTTNAEIPGYNVFCKPINSWDSDLTVSFNPTTNAINSVLPGRKLVWIEKDGVMMDSRKVELFWDEPKVTVDFRIK